MNHAESVKWAANFEMKADALVCVVEKMSLHMKVLSEEDGVTQIKASSDYLFYTA